jgi:hypothetical protein
MIPLSFWLINAQFVISAFGVFAFFSVAWLNVDSWAVRREFKTGLRALGFFLLALWSALHGIGSIAVWADIAAAGMLFGGIVAVLASYVVDRVPLEPKEIAKLRTQKDQERFVTTKKT